ncbi:hypothetical protein ICA16_14975 [Pseudomonas anatoliensis]|uniref:hypothetical protein n=1 Tax=Pseudomonas anatoliensis TaxID=2710589 RepID=UPI001B32D32D|nr:hypothetical protein [Pseudomonas anatoliensis]MBP5956973.1 hypothetical protein [Pseudomonas anatoliensis]
MGNLKGFETEFAKIGFFIPPFVNFGTFSEIIKGAGTSQGHSQAHIEAALKKIYTPGHLAAMVVSRYPQIPIVQDYKVIISESIEAHFLGLNHVAVSGLVPVIEGTARQLHELFGLGNARRLELKPMLTALLSYAKQETNRLKLGAYEEVDSMLDSFDHYLKQYLYAGSDRYSLADKTNRNGITHGSYADADYGTPLNFYKVIGAVDVLCLIAKFQPFAPGDTPESLALAMYYLGLAEWKEQDLKANTAFLDAES